MSTKTLLGFDFGKKRIGVAVGQSITGTASPIGIVNITRNRPDWEKIRQLVRDWRPDALVVGIPLNMDGTPQPMTRAAEKFSRQLQGQFHLPVYGMDERLSSFEAGNRAGRDMPVDAVAAQVILESWLNEHRDGTASCRENTDT